MDPPYDTKLAFAQNFVLRKINEKLLPLELHFLTPIRIKSFAGWGQAPHPAGGAYSAPPDLIAVFIGAYF